MSSKSMNYAAMAQKPEEKIVQENPDMLMLKFVDGKVTYTFNKSQSFIETEKAEAEKYLAKNSIDAQMRRAVADIDKRRRYYRNQDFNNYGYDKYTKEFYYTCPESSDTSDEETE